MKQPLAHKTVYYTRLQYVLAGALLVFVAVFYLFTIRPTRDASARLQDEVKQHQFELEVAMARAGDLPRIAAENDALAVRLAQSKRLPPAQEWAEFVRDITRLSSQCSLRKFTYKYGHSKRTENFAQLPIELEFEGDMLNVYAFLKQVEELPRLTRLRSLQMEGSRERSGFVTVQMGLNTYFASGDR